ncbi:MAG: DUF2062 domain-containing protein [Chitinophagales bacterium]|nr:DUF2062 domain-containing protein [Chitinophagaceae bacterium]MCB9065729.1 DUF2062 domain-containing protein [Chitinophagales bacterium]
MTELPLYEERFKNLKACVLLPTYNNAGTLADVIEDVLKYTSQVIVVNDGSTDDTPEILKRFPQIHVVSYTPNKGKGMALRTGFKEAVKLGYDHAITLDSDGQHFAKDLVQFLTYLENLPNTLLIGSRNMDQENVPGKSSFGNKFSNFWFWVNTGIKLEDTQSGYRSYPVHKLAGKKYFTSKYEFEIEVIVRASWSGIDVKSVPVTVYYPKPEERVSHFRPFKDFTRISILNTILVLISVLWVKPRDFFKKLFSREGRKVLYTAIFATPGESNHKKAASIGFGVFMGIVPIWGFQLAVGIPLAILFRLNKALFIIAANISIPPIMFVIMALSVATGKWILGIETIIPDFRNITLDMVKEEGASFFLGGTVLAVSVGLFAYLLSYIILRSIRKNAS